MLRTVGGWVSLNSGQDAVIPRPRNALRFQVYGGPDLDVQLTWLEDRLSPQAVELPFITLPAGSSMEVPALVPPGAGALYVFVPAPKVPQPDFRLWVVWEVEDAPPCII